MSIFAPAADPLPYQPIRIIDVSPYRSSIRRTSVRRPRRRLRAAAATGAAMLALAALILTAGVAGAEVSGDFRLAPGHAMPIQLA
jgi:ferric-dicitrate binding protein FerR (iron transport regulator)